MATGERAHACLRCGYDLKGLPESGRCPECGFCYDPACRLLRVNVRRRQLRQLLLAAVLAVVMAWTFTKAGVLPEDYWIFVVIGLPAAWAAWRLLGIHGRYCWVTINVWGVSFRHPDKGTFCVEWARIGDVRVTSHPPRFIIERRDGVVLVEWAADVVGGLDSACACASEINRLSQVYSAAQPQ